MRRAGRPAASGRLQGLRDQRKRTESVSPPSSSPDRPSPKRLPGGRAFNLGRSVLGALGNLLPDLAGVKHPFATMCRKVRQSCFSWDSLEKFGPRKSTPRRWLPRPTSQLTAAEATACRRAINLRRSVLGANGTLRRGSCAVKSEPITKTAVCELFFTSSTILRLDACALTKRDQGFAEPGALSSTSPADLPLPRTASREGFVLVASRARRSGNLRLTRGPRKGICRRKPRNLRTRGVR